MRVSSIPRPHSFYQRSVVCASWPVHSNSTSTLRMPVCPALPNMWHELVQPAHVEASLEMFRFIAAARTSGGRALRQSVELLRRAAAQVAYDACLCLETRFSRMPCCCCRLARRCNGAAALATALVQEVASAWQASSTSTRSSRCAGDFRYLVLRFGSTHRRDVGR